MAKPTCSPILQFIRRIRRDACLQDASDGDLLQRFLGEQDEAAFEILLRRHGPMVFDVCRALLGNETDAEDAFQATFLILAGKAQSIRKAPSLASWLHGVAFRTALKARAGSARRHKHEDHAGRERALVFTRDEATWREFREVLHQELQGLPERHRAPLVLCYLEGKTQDEAATQLGLAKGTLKGHLERGRARLRARLVRRGFGPAELLAAAVWPAATGWAASRSALRTATIQAAGKLATGGAMATVTSARVAALGEGVMNAMFLTKLKVAMGVLLVLASFGTAVKISQVQAAGLSPEPQSTSGRTAASEDAKPQAAPETGLHQQIQQTTWFVAKVDGESNTVSLQTQPLTRGVLYARTTGDAKQLGAIKIFTREDNAQAPLPTASANSVRFVKERSGMLLQLSVAADAPVSIDGQPANLADVQPGMQVALQFAPNQPIITRLDALTPGKVIITGLDANQRRLTVSAGGQEWTAPVGSDVTIVVAGKQDALLSDLSTGMAVSLRLGVEADRIVVTSITISGE